MKIDDSGEQRRLLHMRRCHHAHNVSKARNDANSRATFRHRVHGIYLAAPLHAEARTQVQTRLPSRLQPHLMGPLYRDAMKMLTGAERQPWQAGPPLHDRLQSLRQVGR